ncbi:hypothetical protein HGA91_01670 [candidate division WWE3 bacterium]|nr:hypothetical protein [candidate division WWE3 bacterium]
MTTDNSQQSQLIRLRADIGPRARRAGLTSKNGSEMEFEELMLLKAKLALLNWSHDRGIEYRVDEVAQAQNAEALAEVAKLYEQRYQAKLRHTKLIEIKRSLLKQAEELGMGKANFGQIIARGWDDEFRLAKRALIERRAELEVEKAEAKKKADNHRHTLLAKLRKQAADAGIDTNEVTRILKEECEVDFSALEAAIAAKKAPEPVRTCPMPVIHEHELAAA